MSSLAATLTLLWALQEPAPTATGQTSCERTDNACKARAFVKKAATAEPAKRARYLYSASRSYLALFTQTRNIKDLCSARRNFDQSVAVREQTATQRASFEESRAELETLEKKHGAHCRTSNRHKQAEPIAVARSTPTATPPIAAESAPSSQGTTPSPAPGPPELLATTSASDEPVAADTGLLAIPTAAAAEGPAAPPTTALPRRRPTARVAAGASLVVAGVGLAGGLAVSLVARDRMNGAIAALDATATAQGRELTASESAMAKDADARYIRLGHTSAAFGTLAGLSLVTGVVLLAVPPKARTTLRARVRPVGAGIHVTF